MMDLRCRMLDDIRAIEFMAVELNLFLDINPHDHRALNEYNDYTRQLKELKYQFEQHFGPLTNFGYSYSLHHWRWIDRPWPWEAC